VSRTADNISEFSPVNFSDNYFELFGLPQTFRLETAELDRQYQKLQAAFHPDRFAAADASKRLQALQRTSLVNDAYDTLKSPLKRAAYLLRLEKTDPEEHNQAHLGEAFLLRQMTQREDLEILASKENMDGLEAMKSEVEQERDAALAKFESLYLERRFVDAKASYNRLQFLFKLLDEIDAAEEKLLGY
jgi:molecular chaperone HscB